jgi:hypothetical protein
MNKLVAIVIAAVAFSASSYSQTNTVSSANIVGYNQITIPTNQMVLISTSFLNDSNTVAGLFADFPTGSKVSIWSSSQQKYIAVAKGRTGWGTGGTNQISRGTGVFITMPQGVGTNFFVSGDVPLDPTSSVYKVNGLALMSYPYPADIAFTNTALAKNAATGDKISFWNNGWVSYAKGRTSWGSATNIQLKIGQAFFYQSSTNMTLNEVKPYTIN